MLKLAAPEAAAINGVVGLKPTVGLVSRTYIVPISHSQDTAGPITASVREAAELAMTKGRVSVIMIETPLGVANAKEIAAVPGVDVIFAASTDLGSRPGRAGGP